MQHTSFLSTLYDNGKDVGGLVQRSTGRYYTHQIIAAHLVQCILRFQFPQQSRINIIDPFCGDGRMLVWLLQAIAESGLHQDHIFCVHLWDCDEAAVHAAEAAVHDVMADRAINGHVHAVVQDSFLRSSEYSGRFHVVITNPPWDVVKPDQRELKHLAPHDAEEYKARLKKQSEILTRLYPNSMPKKRFSGWGVNMARCGVEVALRLMAVEGICAIVSPASLLADQNSGRLRRWLFENFTVTDIAYYTAEARLFEKVDQPSVSLVVRSGPSCIVAPEMSRFGRERVAQHGPKLALPLLDLATHDYIIPTQTDSAALDLRARWANLPHLADIEGTDPSGLWMGRELDETRYREFLSSEGKHPFVKGRMIRRFGIAEQPASYVRNGSRVIPSSAEHHRIAWRDVSRPSQKRRMIATLIPPGWVTGNSIHVAYFRDDNVQRLKALLVVLNSYTFEAQVRSMLATAHVSLGVVRRAKIPNLNNPALVERLARLADCCLEESQHTAVNQDAEIIVARLYGLDREEFSLLLSSFENLDPEENDRLLQSLEWKAQDELTTSLDSPQNGVNGYTDTQSLFSIAF